MRYNSFNHDRARGIRTRIRFFFVEVLPGRVHGVSYFFIIFFLQFELFRFHDRRPFLAIKRNSIVDAFSYIHIHLHFCMRTISFLICMIEQEGIECTKSKNPRGF